MDQLGVITDNGDEDVTRVEGKIDASGNSLYQDDARVFPEPHVGMKFDSEHAAKIFYEDYAKHVGFTTRLQIDRSKPDFREFSCSRKRAGDSCEAILRIELRSENKWVVTKFVKDHNHSKLRCLRPKRQFAAIDVVPSGVMYVSIDGKSGLNNVGFPGRRRTLGRDAQNLLDYFKKMQAENPGFYYAIQLDEENRMTNAFWADARSRASYAHFGDAVVFDTSYRVNQYNVPFAPFTGVNHHGQIILFGCGLLLDESEPTFIWLFKTLLAAMNDRGPVSLTTDNDRAIRAATTQVFPETRHCVDKWHILREGQDIIARVCSTHHNFEIELYNCINMTKTVEEFESFWESIVEKYDLKRNNWLQSIYDVRHQWAPAYFRDSFFATFPNPGFGGSFFDGYMNQQTTLPMFFRQYERALESSFENEVDADFDTLCTNPVLRTPSPMEKQAANLYTKRVFSKFQDELVKTFAYTANRVDGEGHNGTYRVAKFEDNKAYFVSLNIAEMKANCSCRMFEYSGILCRHILTVFTVSNVLTLPSRYILNRWTRNAKTMNVNHIELHGLESLTVRYNNLCKEAIRFAEQGAVALETYNASLVSLREGAKKVAGARKSAGKVACSSSWVSGVGYDDQRISIASPEMTPLLWPRQDDEIIRRFNLNDAGVAFQSVSDSNVPCMIPVSLHADNMAAVPCLKSMTWVMENKKSTPANRVAVINLKLQDYFKNPTVESEVKFSMSRVKLETMLMSMAGISQKLSASAHKVAVINLKLQDAQTTSGEPLVKFQVSKDTLGAMLRSMAYIREQLSNTIEPKQDNPGKRLCK
ncbi:hypothetical protein CASFOL_035189 [Castilleja foliolosa]|uniref:Protein FAR1-RELATED SEQUENCE n=1 Tax=Castilleja foliolosa TaxID=1961234 RepID=A0ABD3BSN4_9LAMI